MECSQKCYSRFMLFAFQVVVYHKWNSITSCDSDSSSVIRCYCKVTSPTTNESYLTLPYIYIFLLIEYNLCRSKAISSQCRSMYVVLLLGCIWYYASSNGRVWRAMPNCSWFLQKNPVLIRSLRIWTLLNLFTLLCFVNMMVYIQKNYYVFLNGKLWWE